METAQHLHAIRPSYIREILNAATADGVISLAGGLPAPELMPLTLLQQATANLASTPDIFQYGQTQGYAPLLDYIKEAYQLPASYDTLICTGSQQAIDLIARTYINPGDGVAMEAPSYLGALQAFELQQARIVTVPQRSDGPDLEILDALFASGTIKLFYAVPDFHNPTGICWSLDARRQVARLCQQYGVSLIEDIPYRELQFSGKNLPLASSFCPEQALALRSFSKISAPGIRLGAVSGPKQWLSPMIKIKQASDLHSSLPMQAVLLQLIKHAKFSEHINNVRQHYRERYVTLRTALTEQLSDDFNVQAVRGGMFVWLQLPYGEPMDIAKAAITQGVAVVPSPVFYPNQHHIEPALRLNFSHAKPGKLIEAVSRLRKTIDQLHHR